MCHKNTNKRKSAILLKKYRTLTKIIHIKHKKIHENILNFSKLQKIQTKNKATKFFLKWLKLQS